MGYGITQDEVRMRMPAFWGSIAVEIPCLQHNDQPIDHRKTNKNDILSHGALNRRFELRPPILGMQAFPDDNEKGVPFLSQNLSKSLLGVANSFRY